MTNPSEPTGECKHAKRLRALAKLVADMRTAQRDYFRSRTTSTLHNAKRLEMKVDEAIGEALRQEQQLDLF